MIIWKKANRLSLFKNVKNHTSILAHEQSGIEFSRSRFNLPEGGMLHAILLQAAVHLSAGLRGMEDQRAAWVDPHTKLDAELKLLYNFSVHLYISRQNKTIPTNYVLRFYAIISLCKWMCMLQTCNIYCEKNYCVYVQKYVTINCKSKSVHIKIVLCTVLCNRFISALSSFYDRSLNETPKFSKQVEMKNLQTKGTHEA